MQYRYHRPQTTIIEEKLVYRPALRLQSYVTASMARHALRAAQLHGQEAEEHLQEDGAESLSEEGLENGYAEDGEGDEAEEEGESRMLARLAASARNYKASLPWLQAQQCCVWAVACCSGSSI